MRYWLMFMALACSTFSGVAVAQSLNALNLPQSGQTTDTLASRDDMTERLVALLWCDGSMIVGNRTLYGSDECLNIRGENFVSNMAGRRTQFDQFYLETADLGLCETYIYGKFTGGSSFSEALAFSFNGVTASYDRSSGVIELSDVNVIWPEYRDDFTDISGNAKVFVKGPDKVILPFEGANADKNVDTLNEIGRICAALGW